MVRSSRECILNQIIEERITQIRPHDFGWGRTHSEFNHESVSGNLCTKSISPAVSIERPFQIVCAPMSPVLREPVLHRRAKSAFSRHAEKPCRVLFFARRGLIRFSKTGEELLHVCITIFDTHFCLRHEFSQFVDLGFGAVSVSNFEQPERFAAS